MGRFIEDACLVGDGVSVRSCDLYRRYKAWSDVTGERAVSSTAFGLRLGDRGFTSRHTRSGAVWVGIAVAFDTPVTGCDGFEAISGIPPREEEANELTGKHEKPVTTRHTPPEVQDLGPCSDDDYQRPGEPF